MTAVATEKPETAQKASISLSNLKHALKVVSAAIERTATIPILQCIRLEQLPAGLAMESTNLDLAIRVTITETSGLDSPVVIPAEKLMAWTKLLSGEAVKISATSARATLQCGRPRAVFPILPASNWPQLTFTCEQDGFTLKQGDLARALRFALMAVSSDASRYTLNGVLVQGDGETLRFVSTDGHRMMVYSRPCEEKIKNLLMPAGFIKALLPQLTDEDGGVDLAFDQNQIIASLTHETPVHIASKKMAGQFPAWEAVFPKGERTTITVKAAHLVGSLERCLLLADERSGALRLTFGEQITIEASSALSGEATEIVDCIGAPKEPLKIGVNGEYLTQLIKRLDGDLRIALPADAQAPLLFKAMPKDGETLDYIVMPMRV